MRVGRRGAPRRELVILPAAPFLPILSAVLFESRVVGLLTEEPEGRQLPVMNEGVPSASDLPPLLADAAVEVVVLEHAQAEPFVHGPDGVENAAGKSRTEEGEHGNRKRLSVVRPHPLARKGWNVADVGVANRDPGLVPDGVGHGTHEAELWVR